MRQNDSHEAFRAQVRAFLSEAVPADIREAVQAHTMMTREQVKRWHVILNEKGWAAPAWPQAVGGPGWSLAEQAIFKEEMAAADVPNVEHLGIDTIGPTLMRFGTPEQCARFLPRMLSFEDYWAQAYSEPEAGSDLASLKTTAVRDANGDWIVNGAKIWQSMGHWANWAIVLVRSDVGAAKQQDGISVLLVDLTSPGVTVRPIKFITGGDFHAQIFFDNARVPAANLVGEPNQGWHIAKGLLVIERLFVARIGECKAELRHLLPRVQALPKDAAGLAARHRYAELQIRMNAQEAAWWPALQAAERGEQPALEASLLKLDGIALLHDLHLLGQDVLGAQALRCNPEGVLGQPPANAAHAVGNHALAFWRYRGSSLAGGSTEVQQGIIAKTLMRGETEIHQQSAGDDEVGELLNGLRAWLDKHAAQQPQGSAAGSPARDAELWAVAQDMGITAMGIAESAGGLGCSPEALLRAISVLGEKLVREDLVWHSLLPAQILAQVDETLAAPSLATLLAGGRMAVALPDVVGQPSGEGKGASTGFVVSGAGTSTLTGHLPLLLGGTPEGADLLVFARQEADQQLQLWRLPAALWQAHAQAFTTHEGRCAAELRCQALPLSGASLLAQGADAERALQVAQGFAWLALAADSLGAAREAIRQTLAFLSERRQFKRALIEFQVLQTRLVEHVRAWYRAQRLLSHAARDWAEAGQPDLALAHGVKHMAGKLARELALDAPHLHGAMGYQHETAISHVAKRLWANDVLQGNAQAHAAALAARL